MKKSLNGKVMIIIGTERNTVCSACGCNREVSGLCSVKELEKGIMDFIRNWNETGKKYVWIKSATQIRTSINEAEKCYEDYTK